MPYNRCNEYVNDNDVYVRILKEMERIGSPCSPSRVLLGAGFYNNQRGPHLVGKMAEAGLIKMRGSKTRRGSSEVYMTPLGEEYLESHQDTGVV